MQETLEGKVNQVNKWTAFMSLTAGEINTMAANYHIHRGVKLSDNNP